MLSGLFRRKITAIFIMAFLLRITLMFVDYSFDVNNHISWGQDAFNRGLQNFYELRSKEAYGTDIPNYPPLAIFLFLPWYPIQQFLFNTFWNLNINFSFFPSNLVTFVEWRGFLAGLFKIPSILSDIGIGGMVYLFSKKIVPESIKLQTWAVLATLFNPLFLYNSALMGQIDSIPILFSLVLIYLLLYKKMPLLSVFFITLGLLTKPTVIIFLPAYLYLFTQNNNWKIALKSIVVSLATFIISFVPFLKGDNFIIYPFVTYIRRILETQSLQSVSNGALNFWSIFYPLRSVSSDAKIFPGVTFGTFAIILTVAILFLLFKYFFQKKEKNWVFIFYLTSFACVMFLSKMHERYFIIPIVFLMLASLKYAYLRKIFYLYTVFATINIYFLWPVPEIRWLDLFLSWPPTQILISILFLILFLASTNYFFSFFLSNFSKPRPLNTK